MIINKNERHLYSLAFANFLAALGGGLILGKGMGIVDLPFLQGGSVLAFLIGCIIGIAFLQFLPKAWSNIISRYFSVFGAGTSLILLVMIYFYSINEHLTGVSAGIFFCLLSMRFGFWFYSRVLRAAAVAGYEQRIAWVEFGYYSGIILGLIIWNFFAVAGGIVFALVIDIGLQFIAGVIDFFSNKPKTSSTISEKVLPQLTEPRLDPFLWLWRLASSMVFLTVGVQAIIFYLSHQVPSSFGTYILAVFYFGAASAAIFCRKYKIQLCWEKKDSHAHAFILAIFLKPKKINFLFINIISGGCVAISIILVVHSYLSATKVMHSLDFVILFFTGLASFFYSILDLAILDRIGLEEHHSKNKGMIIRTYGLMAVGAACCMWAFGLFKNSNILFFVLLVCFLFTLLMTQKRRLLKS